MESYLGGLVNKMLGGPMMQAQKPPPAEEGAAGRGLLCEHADTGFSLTQRHGMGTEVIDSARAVVWSQLASPLGEELFKTEELVC